MNMEGSMGESAGENKNPAPSPESQPACAPAAKRPAGSDWSRESREFGGSDCSGGSSESGGSAGRAAEGGAGKTISELRLKISIISVTLMAVMGVSSIVPILPLLGRVFAINSGEIGLIVAVFTLPGVFFTLLSGVLSDRLGRKPVLIPALILFSLAGAACAFAPSFNMLLFFRFLQGLGAAPLGMLYTTLIGDMYEGDERLRVLGYNTTALGVSTGCYPFIGGLLGHLDWRLTFCLPLLGLVSAALVWSLPLKKGQDKSNLSVYLRSALSAMKNKRILLLFALSTGTFLLLYGPIVTGLPALCDLRFGANPMNIGLLMAVSATGTALGAVNMSRHVVKHGSRKVLMFSQACYMVSMLALPLATGFWWLVIPMYFYGAGQGLGMPCLSEQLLSNVPHDQRAMFMAFNGTMLRLSQSAGPLLAGLAYWRLGLNSIFIWGFALALLLFIVTGIFLREDAKFAGGASV